MESVELANKGELDNVVVAEGEERGGQDGRCVDDVLGVLGVVKTS